MPTALIAEDEPLLAAGLRAELAHAWPALEVVVIVGDGIAAAAQTLALAPDICFLDIRMPGCSGLEAAQAIAEDWPDARPLRAAGVRRAGGRLPRQAGRPRAPARLRRALAAPARRRGAARTRHDAGPAAHAAGRVARGPGRHSGAAPCRHPGEHRPDRAHGADRRGAILRSRRQVRARAHQRARVPDPHLVARAAAAARRAAVLAGAPRPGGARFGDRDRAARRVGQGLPHVARTSRAAGREPAVRASVQGDVTRRRALRRHRRAGTGMVACVAVLIAELGFQIGLRLLRRAARSSAEASAVVQAARAPAHLTLALLGLDLVWQIAPDHLAGLVSVQRLTAMLLIAAVTWLLVRGVNGFGRAVVDAHPVGVADNLEARRIHTQTKVLTRTVAGLIVLVGGALILMTLPGVRQVGASLLASAGVVGIVAGFAARPVLGNLIAGLQIGLTQPIRIDDVVIVEGEWGVIEEITGAYVVVRIWDQRRLVVPLQYWVEKPFQNWTRHDSELIGTVFLWADYRMPLQPLRDALQRACEAAPEWDRRFCLLQVTEAGERAVQLRALVTAANAGKAWDLRCRVREALLDFMQREYPQYLPRQRADATLRSQTGPDAAG